MRARAVSGSGVCALGMAFPGPVGLAAGFDRDARRLDEIRGWGFGFVELGTVTPLAVPDHNPGVAALAAVLARNTILERAIGERPVIGISLGVQPDSAIEHAWRDTLRGMRALWSSADYLALNFTSANAQGLHGPERRYTLLALLARAKEEQERVTATSGRHVPLLIKWPVGPGSDDAVSIAQRIRGFGYDGMIAAFESDSPVDPAWEGWVPSACRGLAQTLGPRMTLIAVGGIDRVRRALDLRDAGARLVQIYRGFETHGSPLVQAIAGAWTVREGAATAPA